MECVRGIAQRQAGGARSGVGVRGRFAQGRWRGKVCSQTERPVRCWATGDCERVPRREVGQVWPDANAARCCCKFAGASLLAASNSPLPLRACSGVVTGDAEALLGLRWTRRRRGDRE